MSADVDSLYKNARAVLWVEDSETRAWLDAVWLGQAPTISVLVAGGSANVAAMCRQAIDAGWRHVVGLVDQDFGTSNRARWAQLKGVERVYRLDVHEIENLLLDGNALEACALNTGRRVSADIDARIVASARRRSWWLACARFLSDTHRAAVEGYPTVPGAVTSLAEAEAFVLGSEWFGKTSSGVPTLASGAVVKAGLIAAHQAAGASLADGTWRSTFPGKELFREIGGYVQVGAAGVGARLDLVKSVAEWQRANGVPAQATELRAAILSRV